MSRKNRANDSEQTSYVWENIPRGLWERAQRKAANQTPPKKMKWLLLELLTAWLHNKTKDPPPPDVGF